MFQRFGGIDQHSGDLAMDPTSAVDLRNVDLHPVGEIRTRGGMRSLGVAGDPSEIFGIAMLEAGGELYMYAAQANSLRTSVAGAWEWSSGADWAAVSATFAAARYGVEETEPADHHPDAHGTSLYVTNGVGIPWVVWGTGGEEMPKLDYSTETAGVPTKDAGGPEWRDWEEHPPTGICAIGHGTTEQLLAWGFDDDPARIDYSALRLPWHFGRANLTGATEEPLEDGGWFYALADDADVVIGAIQHLSRIVVFKRRTTIVYSGFPGDDLAIENIFPVGCTSYKSVVRVGNELMWWSDQGPVTLVGVQQFGDLQYASVADPIRRTVSSTSAAAAAGAFAVSDRRNMRVIWFLPSSTTPLAVVYYYDSPRRWTIFDGPIAELTCAMDGLANAGGDIVVYGGDADGLVHELLLNTSDNDAPISAYYHTAWQALAQHETRKRALFVDLMYGASGAIGATVGIAWDYVAIASDMGEQVRALGSAFVGWNEATWWSRADADVWEEDGTLPAGQANPGFWNNTTRLISRFAMTGTGFIYQLQLSNASANAMNFAGWRAFLSERGQR